MYREREILTHLYTSQATKQKELFAPFYAIVMPTLKAIIAGQTGSMLSCSSDDI